MEIVSFAFLLFVTAVIFIYFLMPIHKRWIVLLIGSYIFYLVNSRALVLALLWETFVTFLCGRAISRITREGKEYLKGEGKNLSREEKKSHKENVKRRARRVLRAGIILDLGTLLVLKYGNFFAGLARPAALAAGVHIPVLKVILPLGISFYTLQAMAYLFDIYRGKTQADTNPAKFMLFMSYFPQIVQGPIPRHSELAAQLYEGHGFDYTRLCHGAQLMLWGYMKKMLIADRLATPVGVLFGEYTKYRGPIVLAAGILYGIQIYTDFSGGIDIVRGISQILGINMVNNFEQPYFSRSVEEFWRRWHITLGSWMRDYIFYPLSLSKAFTQLGRKSRRILGNNFGKKLPAFISMFIVYLLVGFWHGPEWKYIAYGIWNGIFIMSGILLEETYEKVRLRMRIPGEAFSWRVFQMLRTFLICSVGRLFSRGESLAASLYMIRHMFVKWWDLSFLTGGGLTELGINTAGWILLLFALLLLWAVGMLHERGISIRAAIDRQPLVFRWACYMGAVLVVFVFGVYGPAYDAASFIYGGF